MKKLVLLLVILLSAFTLIGCKKEQESVALWDSFTHKEVSKISTEGITLVNEGYLTVSVSSDYAPYEFIDLTKTGQNKFVGSDICLAQSIAEAMGLKLYIKAMDFDSTMIALDNGIADVAISGISYTADRAAAYLYTDCYLSEGDGGQVLLLKKNNESTYKTIQSLNSSELKIGAQNGTIQLELVESYLPNATLVKIDDLNAAYDSLKSGSLDAIAIAKNVADALVAKSPSDYAICEEPFAFGDDGSFALVKKDNVALANAINKVIAEVKTQYVSWIEEGKTLFTELGEKAQEVIPEDE